MPRWAGTTTQRGLGGDHQTERKRQLAALVDGTPCRRCSHPMRRPDRCCHGHCFYCRLDLGHWTPRAISGPKHEGPRALEHRYCNRAAGARLLNRMKAKRRQHARNW